MSTVGKVKALVAYRKIRNLLIAQHVSHPWPIVERRIDNLVAAKTALIISDGHMTYLSTPTFIQGHSQTIGHERPNSGLRFTGWKSAELLSYKRYGVLDFQPADVCAAEHVSCIVGRDRNMRKTVNPGRLITAGIDR